MIKCKLKSKPKKRGTQSEVTVEVALLYMEKKRCNRKHQGKRRELTFGGSLLPPKSFFKELKSQQIATNYKLYF